MRSTKKKITKAIAIKMALEYIEQCRKLNVPIIRAILFGSLAKGTAHGDSDIDLLLVSEKFKNNTLDNWKLLAPVTAQYFNVEPHPYPKSKFLKGDPFIAEIMQHGIDLKI